MFKLAFSELITWIEILLVLCHECQDAWQELGKGHVYEPQELRMYIHTPDLESTSYESDSIVHNPDRVPNCHECQGKPLSRDKVPRPEPPCDKLVASLELS